MERYSREPKNKYGYRCEFVHGFRRLKLGLAENHSHPQAASLRNSALRSLEKWINTLGMIPYHISMSNREKGVGRHRWHWAKDMSVPQRNDLIKDEHFIVGIDVDYYIEDIQELAEFGNPMCFYSAMPKQMAGATTNGRYCIDKNGRFKMIVNGGAQYTSDLWNYESDTMVFDYPWGSWAYSLEKREFDDMHCIVLLTPIRKVQMPLFAQRWVKGTRMTRKHFVKGNFAMQRYTVQQGDTNEMWVSVAPLGYYASANVPEECFVSIQERFLGTTAGLSIAGITNIMQEFNLTRQECVTGAPILARFFKEQSGLEVNISETRIWNGKIGDTAPNYINAEGDLRADHLQDFKRVGRYLHAPFTSDPITVPAECQANDVASVRNRIEKIRHDTRPEGGSIAKFLKEFCDYVVEGNESKLHPWNIDRVAAEQRAPTQVQRNKETLPCWIWNRLWGWRQDKITVQAFMKKEGANACNDPRNISTVPNEHNLDFSRYTYAVKEKVLKYLSWYAPAKSPEFIANRLLDFRRRFGHITEADGERFDGHITSYLIENICRPIYLRLFAPEHKENLRLIMDRESYARGKTKCAPKIDYECWDTTLSGSPRTTDWNTLISAALDFVALRLDGASKKTAWEALLGYAGDDVTSVASEKSWKKIETIFGMAYKVKAHYDTPVGFLGRKFPLLHAGSNASIQDPERQLSKLHLTFSNPTTVSPIMALLNKATGLVELDPMNPIINAWAKAVYRVCSKKLGAEFKIGKVKGLAVDLPYWLTELGAGWPQVDSEDEYLEWVTLITNYDSAELGYLITQLNNVTDLEDLEQLKPINVVPKPDKRPAQFVDDPMVLPVVKDDPERGSVETSDAGSTGVHLEEVETLPRDNKGTDPIRQELTDGVGPQGGTPNSKPDDSKSSNADGPSRPKRSKYRKATRDKIKRTNTLSRPPRPGNTPKGTGSTGKPPRTDSKTGCLPGPSHQTLPRGGDGGGPTGGHRKPKNGDANNICRGQTTNVQSGALPKTIGKQQRIGLKVGGSQGKQITKQIPEAGADVVKNKNIKEIKPTETRPVLFISSELFATGRKKQKCGN